MNLQKISLFILAVVSTLFIAQYGIIFDEKSNLANATTNSEKRDKNSATDISSVDSGLREVITLTSGINITSVNLSYDYRTGLWHIIGEVLNNSDKEKESVKIVATFYDLDGNVIGTKNTYTDPDNILPSQSAPFDLSVNKYDIGGDISVLKDYKLTVRGE